MAFGLSRGGLYASSKVGEELTQIGTAHVLFISSLVIWLGAYIHGKICGVDFGYDALSKAPAQIKLSILKRTLFGYLAIIATFLAIQFMPVSTAVSIMMTMALATSIFAYFMLDEVVSLPEFVAIAGGFFGCVLITNSDAFISNDDAEILDLIQREALDDVQYPLYAWGVFFAILFCLLGALNILAMRELGTMVHSSVKTFYFGAVSTILTGIFFLFYEPSLFDLWEIRNGQYSFGMNQLCAGVIIGLFSWGAQESQSIAVTIVKSGTAAAFLNVGLIFSLLVDITYFKREAFWTDYAGAGMILLCTSFQAWVST